ncbi:MAG: Glutamate 5-kinase [Candidatus Magasanikbacteria bacterium GW2011_GWA2_45_39]|uniref:Glutamate 5-kinase n=2 Tax=Candidatus Magasanikiibacteriota TaxID=1752731 RepID=A0A0G1MY57_9BACT|nr:MAG: Glutamate 5-kinase [Candidatus Magasanikbacteria bacterium GW2011_GWA2_45_39]KKU13159.1 MAG: Glutamate 5-kinase [Candidatus Magasanikbacteria bacterium GW2011_GWC2_45_8]HBW74224.1 glutamate 5-kinase [Candidatus Magasanikbacteria bacterium]
MQRVVVKIGTESLTCGGKYIDPLMIDKLAAETAECAQSGTQLLIVTSGAAAMGRTQLKSHAKLKKTTIAAVGQAGLMGLYDHAFSRYSLPIAQILVDHDTLNNKEIFLAFQDTLQEMCAAGIVPIINENDALTTGTTIAFGNNDALSGKIALSARADGLIILSHVAGLYDADPAKNPRARLIRRVTDVNRELIKLCSKETSAQGTGGMIAKLNTARLTTACGIYTVVARMDEPQILPRLIAGEEIGTVFEPRSHAYQLKNRDRWILSAKISSGFVVVDDGAVSALKKGKSLLAVGIKKSFGTFKPKQIIEVLNTARETIAIGIVNMSEQTLVKCLESADTYNQEVIHTDNMIVL